MMANKNEKQRRKQLMNQIISKDKENFVKNLPMGKDKFRELFDYLDNELPENDCDDTNRMTKQFLENNDIKNIENVLDWLSKNGGYCDCEILANVEELFEADESQWHDDT